MSTSKHVQFTLVAIVIALGSSLTGASPSDEVSVSAPINTESAGKGGPVALQSVVRVICPSKDSAGTGFLHSSGRIVTADHVVAGCIDLIVLGVVGKPIKVTKFVSDSELDLALLYLEAPIKAPALPISLDRELAIGAQVST